MNKPRVSTFVFGNVFVGIALAAIAALVGYETLIGQAPILAAILCLAVAGGAVKAFQEVEAYRAWEREWNDMGDEPRRVSRAPALPKMRNVVGVVVWVVFAFAALGLGQKPGMEIPVWLFWGASALLALRGLYQMVKGKGGGRAKAAGTEIVAVCLPPPRQSATLQQAYAQAPDYCQTLFRQQRLNR